MNPVYFEPLSAGDEKISRVLAKYRPIVHDFPCRHLEYLIFNTMSREVFYDYNLRIINMLERLLR